MKHHWFLLSLSVLSQIMYAQTKVAQESVNLGSVRLYLGQSRTDVLASMASAQYQLTAVGEGKTNYGVYLQTGGKFALVGNIAFTNDRLTFINKDWNPDESSDYDLAKAIFFASKSLNEQDCESVRLTTSSNDQRSGQIRTAVLSCVGTHRRFEITAFDLDRSNPTGQQKAASLSEILQLEK